ncbi:MAG: heme-binding protein [Phycisphaerae bacterium]|nr:heme-binding protein [Phycisphaerae bacterium]
MLNRTDQAQQWVSGVRMRPVHLFLIIPLVLLEGCASNNKMKRPFMFKEAKLPAGFPVPGPVGEIIIKKYPAYRIARIQRGEGGVQGGPNVMFRPLFNHIKRNDIPMTAPVEMGYPERVEPGEGATSMAFLYGEPSWGTSGADAADQRVVVVDVPAMTVLSIGVRGGYTDANFEKAIRKLEAWVQQHADEVRVVGPPRYMGYNSPFVLGFLKYGEVQLPVEIMGKADVRDAP